MSSKEKLLLIKCPILSYLHLFYCRANNAVKLRRRMKYQGDIVYARITHSPSLVLGVSFNRMLEGKYKIPISQKIIHDSLEDNVSKT